jgi:hypothetical protein
VIRKTKRRMTPQRRAWLRQLLRGPASRTGRGNVGCSCMRLGWTDWEKNERGEMTELEVITDAGRAALSEP